MSNSIEKKINEQLETKSHKFMELLKKYLLKTGESLGLEKEIIKRIERLDSSVKLKSQHKIIAPNGRKSKIDLYFDTPELKIIIELKAGKAEKGKVGFRGVAQAAYYNKCLLDGHHLVIILANGKGKDYQCFIDSCLQPNTQKGIIMLTYDKLKIDPLSF